MAAVHAGRLDQRVEVQQCVKTRQDDGSYATTWTKRADAWAQIEPLGGREDVTADAVRSVTDYRVTIRYIADLALTDRITWNGRELYITSAVMPDGKRIAWELMCTETHGKSTPAESS